MDEYVEEQIIYCLSVLVGCRLKKRGIREVTLKVEVKGGLLERLVRGALQSRIMNNDDER